MTVISLLLLACGLALILNTIVAARGPMWEFPRPGAPDARTRGLMRMLPISLGVFLLLAGVAMSLIPATSAP